MKRIFILTALLFHSVLFFAQIGGLSASKLAAYSYSCVPKHKIEFEPSFAVSYYNSAWDRDGNKLYYPSLRYDNSFGFRFTYGLSDKCETGISLPTDVSSISWGIKHLLYSDRFFSLSAISGVNFEFDPPHRTLHQAGIGVVSTLQYTQSFSTDLNAMVLKDFEDNNYSLWLIADNGIYIGHCYTSWRLCSGEILRTTPTAFLSRRV